MTYRAAFTFLTGINVVAALGLALAGQSGAAVLFGGLAVASALALVDAARLGR